jgi:hypothetical protein
VLQKGGGKGGNNTGIGTLEEKATFRPRTITPKYRFQGESAQGQEGDLGRPT